ncbi:MAG: NADAR family protein [Armatimonas sp.]
MPIRFYSTSAEYAFLSNFSAHGFRLDGVYWPTVEHYFQAMKFPDNPEYQEKIRTAVSPKTAKSLGRTRAVPIRADWNSVRDDIMRRAVMAKFAAHPELAEALKNTGTEPLIEASPRDYYWGEGRTGTGKNRLGEILKEERESYGKENTDTL